MQMLHALDFFEEMHVDTQTPEAGVGDDTGPRYLAGRRGPQGKGGLSRCIQKLPPSPSAG